MTVPWLTTAPPYIIAEIGVNHDGSVERALELVDAAATAGASAVKLQLFKTDLLMSRASRLAAYQKSAGEQDPFAMLRRLELTVDEMAPIVDRASSHGLDAIVTVFSVELVREAERLNWNAYKSASPDVINRPLLEAMANTGRPLIVSAGAATLEETTRAAQWLDGASDRIAFLQCVSSYPTPPHEAALGGMLALREAIEAPVGYSDHTAETDTGALATQLGACILEKHLTYDRAARGPDHAASLEPDMFKEYVTLAREAAAVPAGHAIDGVSLDSDPRIGPIEKCVSSAERDVRHVSRQSIVARHGLVAGQTITRADLTIKRPGIGIEPWRLNEIVGQHAARAIESDTPLVDEDIA